MLANLAYLGRGKEIGEQLPFGEPTSQEGEGVVVTVLL